MKEIRNAVWEVIKRFFLAIVSTIGVFIIFGLILDKLELIIYSRMGSTMGHGAILVTGIVGTPLHETAHWLGCKLFGFEVLDVELFRPIASKADGILGYVKYSYSNTGIWSRIGCFITGMAPMILGSVFMILIVWLVVPEVFASTRKSIEERSEDKIPILSCWWAAFTGFWKGMFSLRKWGILRGVLCIYLVTSIAMHMTVSGQDIKAASAGFLIIALVYLVYAIVTAMIGNEYVIAALKRGGFIAAFLSIGLMADGLMLLISLLF